MSGGGTFRRRMSGLPGAVRAREASGCLVVLALLLAGCRERPASKSPDVSAPAAAIAPDAGTVALAPPASQARDAGPCDEVWRDAQVDVAFKEEPEDATRERKGPRLERRFEVKRQLHGAYRYGDQWASVLEYEAGPVRGGVSYSLAVPGVLSDLTGRTVTWASHREPVGKTSPLAKAIDRLAQHRLVSNLGDETLGVVVSVPPITDRGVPKLPRSAQRAHRLFAAAYEMAQQSPRAAPSGPPVGDQKRGVGSPSTEAE